MNVNGLGHVNLREFADDAEVQASVEGEMWRARAREWEGMCNRLARLGAQKHRQVVQARAIIQAAIMGEACWEDRADAWLDETGPEGGDA